MASIRKRNTQFKLQLDQTFYDYQAKLFSLIISKRTTNREHEALEKTRSQTHLRKINKQTYPADCRKIAAVDSNKHDWD